MSWVLAVLQVLILVALWSLRTLLRSGEAYAKEKGKNLATKEDVAVITEQVKTTEMVFERELASFKRALESEARLREVRFTALQNKRVAAIETLYALLQEAVRGMVVGMMLWNRDPEKTPTPKGLPEFSQHFHRKKIYFSEDLCREIDTLLMLLNAPGDLKYEVIVADEEARGQLVENLVKRWDDEIHPQVYRIQKRIEGEFRVLLGVSDSGKAGAVNESAPH